MEIEFKEKSLLKVCFEFKGMYTYQVFFDNIINCSIEQQIWYRIPNYVFTDWDFREKDCQYFFDIRYHTFSKEPEFNDIKIEVPYKMIKNKTNTEIRNMTNHLKTEFFKILKRLYIGQKVSTYYET